MADYAMRFLDAFGLTRVDVLGLSLSGMVSKAGRFEADGTMIPSLNSFTLRAPCAVPSRHPPGLWSGMVISAQWLTSQSRIQVSQIAATRASFSLNDLQMKGAYK
jgi:hypothetical protein